MNYKQSSCLVAKLSHYIDLTDEDVRRLSRLEGHEREYPAQSVIHEQGVDAKNLYVVKSGWAYSFVILQDGSRHILDIHYPGDIVGTTHISFAQTHVGVASVDEAVMCPFPKAHLDEIFEHSPRLTALLYAMNALDSVVLVDRLKSIGRMDAKARLALFLLQVVARIRITQPKIRLRFHFPLTQSLVGDLLGLSSVHVSRTFSRLENAGLIERQGREISILDEGALKEMSDFNESYYIIDTSWFPKR